MSTISKTSTRMERDLMDYLDRHPTAITRIEQHRLQHMQTVGSAKVFNKEGIELPDFGGGKSYPPPLPEREEYVVEFSGFDDPRHAQNFAFKKKLIISVVLVFDSLAATFASSIFSAATVAVGDEFNVGREVVTLGTSLFVLGYAVGPSVFAPISELYGRRVPVIFAAFSFGIFNTAVAIAKDYQTLVISRFFAGFMGSAPLALCGAVFADMFDNKVISSPQSFFKQSLLTISDSRRCHCSFLGYFDGRSFLWPNGKVLETAMSIEPLLILFDYF
jgi:MFS transporter, DHA1 family, multidrug resistance protein